MHRDGGSHAGSVQKAGVDLMRTMEDLIACFKKRIDQLNKDIKAVFAITYD